MTTAQKALAVILEGYGPARLDQTNYVATGGEGSVFRHGGFIVKIYLDRRKMRQDGMTEKIGVLSAIRHPYIVSPRGIVTDGRGEPIGFYMNRCDGEPFPRMFTNAFRARSGFDDRHASILVDRMRETVLAAHGNGAIMADANEMNWIAMFGNTYGKPEPRAIDVDSWAIGRWPAKVIMPSIRDWHHTGRPDRETDWFAWGIVSFQVYAGIHPYKGSLNGYAPGDLERRLRDNASVFSPGVGLNTAVRDFSTIPGRLLDWYIATFQHGQRNTPPSPFDTGFATARIAQTKRVLAGGGAMVIYERLYDGNGDPAIRTYPCGVLLLRSGTVFDLARGKRIAHGIGSDAEVVGIPEGWLIAQPEHGSLKITFIDGKTFTEHGLASPVRGNRLIRAENRLFVVTDGGLTELRVSVFGRPLCSAGDTWGALRNATRWFDGMGIQDLFGSTYLIVPFGDRSCAQVRVKELDALVPIAAKSGNAFATVIVSDRNGTYRKFEFSFEEGYAKYRLWENGTDRAEINVAILPRGVCATIVNDGELDLFVPTTGKLNRVMDGAIRADMPLDRIGEKVVYIDKGSVWQMRLK
ncbi:MAG: hypothetical protein WCJ25_03730 [Candidatus Moraniibacteriota bacterium]